MMKSLKTIALTLALTAGALGCATGHVPSSGDPVLVTPAGGSVISSAVTTPGSAGPAPMISTAVDPGVDAIAVLEANRGFEGRVLGPASPGNAVTAPQQNATGQFISPAVSLVPVGTSAGSLVGGSVVGGSVTSPTASGANFGVTGVSNATATGIAGTTTPATNMTATTIAGGAGLPVTGTGVAPVLSAPNAGTNARLSVDNTAVAATRSGPTVRVETAPGGGTVVTNSNP